MDEANWLSIFREEEVPYYDARWCLPFSWFFFYKPSDLILFRSFEYKGDKSWIEPRFFAEKSVALRTFSERRNLLAAVAKAPYSSKVVLDHFVDNLEKWPGDYLYMDPTEIIEGTEEALEENCSLILKQLDDPGASVPNLVSVLGAFSTFTYTDEPDYRMHLLGTTYTWTKHPF